MRHLYHWVKGGYEKQCDPTPRVFCVNAVDKGFSEKIGVNAVDKRVSLKLIGEIANRLKTKLLTGRGSRGNVG